MKKTYSKPDILFEDFSLDTSISAGCETKILTSAKDQCGMKFGDLELFVSGVSGCLDPVVDGSDEYNGLCYHVPVDTKNIFNS